MQTEIIEISRIKPNDGQFPGLPRNPRLWSVKELEKLKRSIQGTPELVELRPPIVVRHGDEFVVIGGNMRLAALQELGETQVPCIVIPDGTPISRIKEIAIKDNTQFGSWDYDALANDWDDYDLPDFGIPIYDLGESPAPSGSGNASPVDDRTVIEIELSPDEFQFVTSKLRPIAPTLEEAVLKTLGL